MSIGLWLSVSGASVVNVNDTTTPFEEHPLLTGSHYYIITTKEKKEAAKVPIVTKSLSKSPDLDPTELLWKLFNWIVREKCLKSKCVFSSWKCTVSTTSLFLGKLEMTQEKFYRMRVVKNMTYSGKLVFRTFSCDA